MVYPLLLLFLFLHLAREYLAGNLNGEVGHLSTDVALRTLRLGLNLAAGILDDAGCLLLCLGLRLGNYLVAGLRGLLQYLRLPCLCLLQQCLTLGLDVGQLLIGLTGTGQRLVDKLLALLYHASDNRKSEFRQQDKDYQECDEHPYQ